VEELFQQWKDLNEATKNKELMLEEALALVRFNRKVDGVLSLIRDHVAVASSQETGRDLDHCKIIIKKFDDFEKVRKGPLAFNQVITEEMLTSRPPVVRIG